MSIKSELNKQLFQETEKTLFSKFASVETLHHTSSLLVSEEHGHTSDSISVPKDRLKLPGRLKLLKLSHLNKILLCNYKLLCHSNERKPRPNMSNSFFA